MAGIQQTMAIIMVFITHSATINKHRCKVRVRKPELRSKPHFPDHISYCSPTYTLKLKD